MVVAFNCTNLNSNNIDLRLSIFTIKSNEQKKVSLKDKLSAEKHVQIKSDNKQLNELDNLVYDPMWWHNFISFK